ncbi:hypothetical protein DIPPA_10636 [Diplonema papillatum]|nr:hypothetical protein DIPPA_10636 [Diplonema papillatum]
MAPMVVPHGNKTQFTNDIKAFAQRLNQLADCKHDLPNTNASADKVMGTALRDFLKLHAKKYPEAKQASAVLATVDDKVYTFGSKQPYKLVDLFHHADAWPDKGVDQDCIDKLVLAVDLVVGCLEHDKQPL